MIDFADVRGVHKSPVNDSHNVTLTPLEIEYLLFKLGVGVADHGLKPGRGLTGEGAIALRMKLERARG